MEQGIGWTSTVEEKKGQSGEQWEWISGIEGGSTREERKDSESKRDE